MGNLSISPKQQVRIWKNHLIQQYLHYRINSSSALGNLLFRRKPCNFIWILSHMRSGSSLLTLLLNSNPEIIGYGETHIQYQSREDFNKLIYKVYWKGQEYKKISDLPKLALKERYVLDKLLHNSKFSDENLDLLLMENLKIIFLIRAPHRSLLSIRDLKPDWSEEKCLAYYCGRLKKLVNYANFIQPYKKVLLIKYEQLIEETSVVFTTLQDFLETQQGFTEEYSTLKTTGVKGVGDHKGNILSGQIVRTQRKIDKTISEAALEEAQAVYEDCCQQLTELTSGRN